MDAEPILDAMARSGRTLAVAESFTGGAVLDALTDIPGSSRVLRGGLVAYADDVKRRLLGVRHSSLLVHGAVSEPVALEMARGVRARLGADYGLSTTGIAGPTGATPSKPLGLSVAAASGPRSERALVVVHAGDRWAVKASALQQALDALRQVLGIDGIV